MGSLDDTLTTTGFAPTTKITIRERKDDSERTNDDAFLSVNGHQPLADVTNRQSLSRPVSTASKTSDASRLEGTKDGETRPGAVVIGMDSNVEAATASRTSLSRGSEMNETSEGEDKDTEANHSHEERHDPGPRIGALRNGSISSDRHETAYKRHSTSSSIIDATSRVPANLAIDQHLRRSSSSSSSTSSTASISANQRSRDDLTALPRPRRQSSSIDQAAPSNSNTDPTTVNSETASQGRPQSATEFQKFRDHLHHSAPTTILEALAPSLPVEPLLHPNPHHPGTKTEILRIERVYTPIALPTKTRVSEIVQYDVLIPRFSPDYPRILGEYGIGEEEWGRFIGRVNRFCIEAFDPFRWSNLVINVIALLTLWMSEWIMPNLAKRVKSMERRVLTLEIDGVGKVY